MISDIDVMYVKSPNLIDFLINIAKNTINLLRSNKENQLKDKKRRCKKRLWQSQKKI